MLRFGALRRAPRGDFHERLRAMHAPIACGRFGADMQVSLVNDGPVTFWLQASAHS